MTWVRDLFASAKVKREKKKRLHVDTKTKTANTSGLHENTPTCVFALTKGGLPSA